MNCTCPETMRSQEHSPECYLRNRIREDKITIDAFAKESLQDREKLANVEKRATETKAALAELVRTADPETNLSDIPLLEALYRAKAALKE